MLKQASINLSKRITAAELTVYIAFIAGILMSFPLWHSDRLFPLAPVSDTLSPKSEPLGKIIAVVLIGLLAVNCFLRKAWVNVAFLFLICMLLLRDMNRVQPWVYMYILVMVPFTLRKQFDNDTTFKYLRILLVGVYLWSGIHKINPTFPYISFFLMVTKLFKITDPKMLDTILPFGHVVSIIEILMAIALIFPKTRFIGTVTAVATHILILLFISPVGANDNFVVVPWNVAMIVLVILAFYGTSDKFDLSWKSNSRWQLAIAYVLVWLMPVFNLLGVWPPCFSFQLYANKEERILIAVADPQVNKIHPSPLKFLVPIGQVNGGKVVDINAWMVSQTGVPLNHDRYVFRYIARYFCNMGVEPGQLFVLLFRQEGKEPYYEQVQCVDIDEQLR